SNGKLDKGLIRQQRAFGYTLEDLKVILAPMAADGQEPIGSMGNDTPLAVLSDRPQPLYNYFKQLFAQVTNPPLDAIREEIVTMLITTIGSEGNLLDETPEQCRLLRLETPVITNAELAKIRALDRPGLKARTFSTLFRRAEGPEGMRRRMDALRAEISAAIAEGVTLVILSDRGVNADLVPIPALLATAGVHHHLIREASRTRCGLIIESGEPREVHHFALLTGYGAGAVNPYLALATIADMKAHGYFDEKYTIEKLEKNFIKAVGKGLLKVASKMGISTQQSYRGAQIFEAIGLNRDFIDEYFTWTPSRIAGVGITTIAEESLRWHEYAWPRADVPTVLELDVGGQYSWRRKGEAHLFNPDVIAKLQRATQINSREEFRKFCELIDNQERQLLTLRGLLEFKQWPHPVPLDEVEPASEIVKRFATGAMSYGSISKEAHETLAIAMNRIGGRSNTGEGGEDPARYELDANGDSRNSSIKQVASGRFGVTSNYLVHAQELQIKMAQGAKPGEGGQLPGHKVDQEIARIRHSTPGVGLISPPPHHDIYSIEDLAQLIHDLKNSNRDARISVKLVAEVGVGTVAAGVAKGKSDVVLISGHDGGTGASPITSIKHAGIPWELGLAETHQVLVKNDLRGRIIVQTDGQLRTPRDVAIAAMLGAEEWGIATGALVTVGCIMMRKCHLNTCPVGIATQDPALRAKFSGKPEHVVNYFFLVAEGLREIMARLGFRTVNEMVGRVDMLYTRPAIEHWKARGLDFSKLLYKPEVPSYVKTYCAEKQDHGIEQSMDMTTLVPMCREALDRGQPVVLDLPIRNIHRTAATVLSSEITKRYGPSGLPDDTIQINFRGTAGQSLMAFGAPGLTVRVEGDVNDYLGKGLSGGKVIVYPDRNSGFKAEQNIIAGNVVLYGATSGEVYIRGIAGERFCVRNSGARAVVEGTGDHGCEYMTGGVAVILGETGRNFAAGMSGGIAYVLDESGEFPVLVNKEMVELEDLSDEADQREVLGLVRRHVEYTGSERGKYVLDHWPAIAAKFVKVMPVDYKRALAEMHRNHEASGTPAGELVGAK
ncbi:MAG TPA: glutamate synthase large subunit, partial [Pirellulales bacterium]|nr:glutamate synthase large subunit [Pirellulales bacterium]